MEWEEIQPNIWKPEQEGDALEGVLISKDKAGQYDSNTYALDTPKGQVSLWGTAILNDKMKYVNVGETVKIVFEGRTETKKGQPVLLFKVYKAVKEKQ